MIMSFVNITLRKCLPDISSLHGNIHDTLGFQHFSITFLLELSFKYPAFKVFRLHQQNQYLALTQNMHKTIVQ